MSEKAPYSMTTCMMEAVQLLEDVGSMQNIERTLHNIVKNLTRHLDIQTCAVIQINPQTEMLEIMNSEGLSWNYCKQYRRRIISPVVHDLIWESKSLFIDDASLQSPEAVELQLEKPFLSAYSVGLNANHRPLGLLHVDSKEPGYFDEEKRLMIDLYARIISMAIMKEKMLQDVQQLAHEQQREGVESYSYFYGRLQEAIARAQRLSENISLVLLDIVKFGNILCMYGLDVCKNLMNEVTSLVRKNLRQYDNLSVFGTDELIISLPGAGVNEARAATVKLYSIIKQSVFTQHEINIDLSVGIASFPVHARDFDHLITATKNALIEAKRKSDSNISISPVSYV